MKNRFSKLIVGIALTCVLSISAFATTSSVNLGAAAAAGSATNVPTLLSNGVNVLQFTLTSAANNTAQVIVRDAPGTNITYTIGAYSNVVTYATNYITTWTNYYGATNSITNFALVDLLATNNASTNFWPTMYTLTAPTNSTVTFTINQRFNYGVLVTNSAGGACTLQMQYTQ